MNKFRLIGRLDIKNESVIKGIHLEGLRKIGNPNELAEKYYLSGVDELVFMDAVAAYYDRNSLSEIIKEASNNIFVPITVGGGIRNIKDIEGALRSGADKVAINTQALKTPEFISEAARIFGSQCIVVSIETKARAGSSGWDAYFDNGRENSKKCALSWAKEVVELGAGELLVTSVDREGTRKGLEIESVTKIAASVDVPVIASGGVGNVRDVEELLRQHPISAVAVASVLHYDLVPIEQLKAAAAEIGYEVRA